MILHSLKHTGSYAFPADEIAINFESLPALLAVSGKNGAGKTTTFDLIVAALYLVMPYRPGALYRNFVRDGYIELAWEMDDQVYVSYVRVSLAPEKTEAALSVLREDGTTEMIAGPLAREYRKAVEAIVGPLDVLLASMYAVQNGTGAFLRAPRADRKEILANMLGLQRYPRLLEATKTRATQVDTSLATLRTRLATHEATAAQRPDLEARRAVALQQRTEAEARHTAVQVRVTEVNETATRAREARAQLDPLQQELPRLEKELGELGARLLDHDNRLANNLGLLDQATAIRAAVAQDAELRTTKTRLEALRPERAQLGTQLGELDTRLGRIRTQVDENRTLLGRADEIRAACKRDGELTGQIEALDVELEEARQAFQATTAERTALVLKHQQAEANLRTFTADVARLTRQAGLRADVPCRGEGEYAGCQFLVDASAAAVELPQAQEALQAAQATLEQLLVPAEPKDGAAPLLERKTALQREKQALAAVVALATSLDASEARLETYAAQLADAEGDLTAKAERQAALEAELATLPSIDQQLQGLAETVALVARLEAATSRVEELTAAVAGLRADLEAKMARHAEITAALGQVATLDDQVRTTQQAYIEAEQRRREAQQDVTVLGRDLGALDGQLAGVLEAEAVAATLRTDVTPLAEDLGDWTLLTKAFSATGIPALLIDQALPEIGRLATELLRECFGESVFTITLATQRTSADGERQLETLDVIVSRGADPIDAALLSGGESVLVSESLSLALALYNATRSGRSIRTLLRDEVSAPLDVERAPAYARMLRRAVQLGGFRHVLFVSHQPACLELADAQLEVGGGAVKVA